MVSKDNRDSKSEASHRLRLLSDLTRLFAEAVFDERGLFRAVAEQIAIATGDACTVRLLTDDKVWLEPLAVHHAELEIRSALQQVMQQTTQRADAGVWKQVMEEQNTIRIPVSPQQLPPDASPKQIEFIRRFPARYFMAVPLVARSRVIGGISLVRFEPDIAFSDDEETFLRELADRAALSIDNARLIAAERRARENAERAEAATRQELAERKKAEKALEETEVRLRHAQKMEAVGRLAGGIAHDFNNVLTVILSYSELLKLRADPSIHDDLDEIQKAGRRAAALTRQLLAFSRQQVLEPRVLSINEIISGIEKMLRTIVGESVELSLRLDRTLYFCRVDPSQFEQVLMNLVVNARDAMPQGGLLTIETGNVFLDHEYVQNHPDSSPGPHVVLAVSDTGCGMDKATQARIFEPFFTTKPKDQGTGLGLATVYGIVKQSGGSIWMYSELGIGTTFKIYIPRDRGTRDNLPPEMLALATKRGTETVLLVEDEAQVRGLVRTILRSAGYHVLEASSGVEAVALCEQHGAPIQLLLTDVVMPRMSGRVLAEQLNQRQPAMKILYMSGYTEDAVVLHGVLQSGINYLSKPITPGALLQKVRQVLDT